MGEGVKVQALGSLCIVYPVQPGQVLHQIAVAGESALRLSGDGALVLPALSARTMVRQSVMSWPNPATPPSQL